MKRKRVDWEKEMRKTEEIRMRGFKISILGFAVAVLFLFGASRINNDTSFVSHAIMTGCLIAATIVLVFTFRRSAKKSKQLRDEENEEHK
jgi:Ca2+/Na+ antiporter